MKKIIMVVIIVSILIAVSGCGINFGGIGKPGNHGSLGNSGNPDNSGTTDPGEAASETINIVDIIAAFLPPARVTGIDFNADDPSNDDISFIFDEEGRVKHVFYFANGHDIGLSYVYDSEALDYENLWILGFIDSIVVADERIKTINSTFDASIGFVDYKGYFIKGFIFS